jgi:hypothetical protein
MTPKTLVLPLGFFSLLSLLFFAQANIASMAGAEHQATVSVSATVPGPESASGSGSGSGGPGPRLPLTGVGVTVSGQSYPGRPTFITLRGFPTREVIAGVDGGYSADFPSVTPGEYVATIRAIDAFNSSSATRAIRLLVVADAKTSVAGFNVPPTLHLRQLEVRAGEEIAVYGSARPGSSVVVSINNEETATRFTAGVNGVWSGGVTTVGRKLGSYSMRARHSDDDVFSRLGSVRVSLKTVPVQGGAGARITGDLNGDTKVNLVDFSILAFWYNKKEAPSNIDLSGDGRITLIDFSILAYAWQD